MRQPDALAEKLLARLRAANLPTLLVAAFTKAKPGTVGSWLGKGQPPRGERLNRLQHMLAVLGIESPELALVPEYGRYLGRLMAFEVITFAQARSILGDINDQAVFQTVRGQRDPWSEEIEKKPTKTLEELTELYQVLLAEAESQLIGSFVQQGYVVPEHVPGPAEVASAVPLPEDESDNFRFLLESARALGGILPLVRHLASDACSPQDRALLRNLLGEDGMFELSTLINRLCSERANVLGG
jgi:hypothetical protein